MRGTKYWNSFELCSSLVTIWVCSPESRLSSRIDTVFTFNQGSLDGPLKRYNPRGFVVDKVNNSTWGMQFIWPIKAEYLITHLSPDYSVTVVGRNRRDYVWIMARTPQIPDAEYQRLVEELRGQGYDISKLRKVPHGGTPNR